MKEGGEKNFRAFVCPLEGANIFLPLILFDNNKKI